MDPNALLLIAVLIAAFYLLLVRPARQRQKEQAATVSKVVPGVRVMTTAGLFGTVTAVDGDQIDLEIAPGVTVRYVAAAVARIIEDPARLSTTFLENTRNRLSLPWRPLPQ